MCAERIHVELPEAVADSGRAEQLTDALTALVGLFGNELTCAGDAPATNTCEVPVRYGEKTLGRVLCAGGGQPDRTDVSRVIASVLESVVDREMAVADLADAMIESYEELNMLYAIVPNIATKTHASDIGRLLVDEAARMLKCRRVSLLVIDEQANCLRILASRGLPPEAANVSIPLGDSIAGRVFLDEGCLVVNDAAAVPELITNSRGDYEGNAFAVVRVPLVARDQPLGVLTATEREDGKEFSARDRKLLQGLSSLSASALLNCRLHAANRRRMISTIQALASAVDAKDHYTHDHSARVAQLCMAAARELGVVEAAALHEIELAGLLHDIGKIGITDAILMKKQRLTPEEFAVVKTHAEIGARIVGHVDGLDNVARAILHHHERYDGLGYPLGLVGDAIPFGSRLIAVSDVYDTLTSDRPYRSASPPEVALREIQACKGSHFDPATVDAFERVIRRELEFHCTPVTVGGASGSQV